MAFLRNLLKVISVSSAFALVAGISLAYANINTDGFNNLTGPNSENRNRFETDKDLDVRVDNEVDVENDYDVEVETGDNRIEENTEVGDIMGGDIDVSVSAGDGDIISDFGSFSFPDMVLGDIDVSAENSITGPNSLNKNDVFANQDIFLRFNNDLKVENDVDFDANSGDNRVEENTIVGDFQSGDVSVNANLATPLTALDGMSDIDLGDFAANDVTASFGNDTTGPRSENVNRLEANSDVRAIIDNEIDIENDLDFDVNSGDNRIEENTVVGDIETGSVVIDVMVD